MISRRTFLGNSIGLTGLLGLNSSIPSAKATDDERRFLFVFCEGGWDQCYLFAPLWGIDRIDMEPNSFLGEIGGIRFVDSPVKTHVPNFLRAFGRETCFLNGIGVRSVAHDTCLRLISAGTSNDRCNDWASVIASQARGNYLLPHVVLSGPSYSTDYASYVSRVGQNGQLGLLLPSENFHTSELDAFEDQWLRQFHEVASMPNSEEEWLSSMVERTLVAEQSLQPLQGLEGTLNLLETTDGNSLAQDMARAVALLGNNVSRCVSLKHRGFQNLGYDSHASNAVQGQNLNELFYELNESLRRVQAQYPSLYQNLTVVVLSEMGRYPQLNQRQGKTHWMHTSAILIGSGVQGDQVVGEYDSQCLSSPIDLETGEVTDNGVLLKPEHLGATLMQLADATPVDPIQDVPAIQAVLR